MTPRTVLRLIALAAAASAVLAGCSDDNRVNVIPRTPDTLAILFQDGVHPVIDYRGTRDAVIKNGPGIANANFGAVSVDTLGFVDTAVGLRERRLLIRFDLGLVPATATVVEAELSLDVGEGQAGNPVIEIYEVEAPVILTGSWTEGAGFPDDGVSWLFADGAVPWDAPGGDAAGAALDAVQADQDTTLVFALATNLVQRWVQSPGSNDGLLIAARAGIDEAYRTVYMRETATGSMRPRLRVAYILSGG